MLHPSMSDTDHLDADAANSPEDSSEEPTIDRSAEMLRGKPEVPRGPDPMIGRTVGHFTIKRIIGQGGMGAVYEAMQDTPRRVVALKMIRTGVTSRSAIRRFQYEVQTLARLRHPGIAQIYEAGMTDQGEGGTPWFAMEYLAGSRILTHYAEDKKLDSRQRLALFAKVCDAAHHGHQKGIIHRDLKPGNILVTSNGDPKIIDFGVARSTDSDMAVTTLQTDMGALIGTMQYMSPEQCAADPNDIDVRSDVYALGVVLYELLTNTPPYDISNRPIHEAARIVREEPPTKPSTVIRLLRGDIETICLKALEKDRDRRYQSAVELRQDIGRYLDNEPITARRPTLTYQLQLLYRRHRAPVLLSIILVILLVLGAAALSVLASTQAAALQEAHRQGIRSQNVIDAIQRMLEPPTNSDVSWGRDVTYETVLDQASSTLDDEFKKVDSGEDASEAAVFSMALAHAYLTIGAVDKARGRIDSAWNSLAAWLPADHHEFFDVKTMDIVTSFAEGREAHAMQMGPEHLARMAKSLGRHNPDVLGAAWAIADEFRRIGQPDAATQLIGKLIIDMTPEQFQSNEPGLDALYFLCSTPTKEPPPTLMTIINRLAPMGATDLDPSVISLLLLRAWDLGHTGGHPEAALQLFQRLQPSLGRFGTNEHLPRWSRIYRGETLRLLGRHDESVQLLERQIEMDRNDPSISDEYRDYAIEKLAETYDEMGRTDEAASIRQTITQNQ
jgi:serine/threonine protein kinase